MSLKVCRTCCQNEGTYCLYNKNESDLQISAKVSYCCAKINIEEGDGLPSSICEECKEELEAAYRFVMKCESADRKLRSQCVVTEEGIKTEVKVELSEDSDLDGECNDDNLIENEFELVTEHSNKKIIRNKPFKEYTCLYCDYKIKTKKGSLIHLRTHLSDGAYPCPKPNCVRKYKLWGSVITHMKAQHCTKKKQFICETCGKVFVYKQNLRVHLRVHTKEKPYMCPHCPGRFTQRASLYRHKRIHTGDKPFSCSICAKRFYTKKDLKRHEPVHTNDRTFECHICNLLLKTKPYLDHHLKLHLEPKNYVCDHCGKTLHSKNTLKDHIENLHSVKSGYCELCSKSVSNLEVHMWKHTGQKMFKCETCDSSFVSFRSLSTHISFRHKSTGKYRCTFEKCDMTFPRPCLREFHIAKVHKTAFTHSCDRCSRGFYRLSDLARHKKQTHNEIMNNKKLK